MRAFRPAKDNRVRSTVFLLAATTIVAISVLVAAQTTADSAASKATLWSAGELKWVDNPAIKGARQAVLWGDPAKEAYGAMKSVPAGTVLPPHSHTSLTRFVVVSGTLSFTLEDGAPRTLGPQAYGSVPGGVKHSATCQMAGDCVYFETAPAAYDFVPAGR